MKVKIKPHQKRSPFKEALAKRASTSVADIDNSNFLVSFQHLDRQQGQTFEGWQSIFMLATAMETLRNYCSSPLRQQFSDSFTEYGDFPPPHKTEFTHPSHVPPDAKWARIHVNGKHCVIGHIVGNVFYLVFFDQDHVFWKSELKNT